MTRAELMQRMSYGELVEWMAYYELEPFGAERQDLRFARLMALIANMARGKSGRKLKPKDFMLDFDKAAARSSDQRSFAQKIRAIAEKRGALFTNRRD